jgi:hypothetical protein
VLLPPNTHASPPWTTHGSIKKAEFLEQYVKEMQKNLLGATLSTLLETQFVFRRTQSPKNAAGISYTVYFSEQRFPTPCHCSFRNQNTHDAVDTK